MKKDQDPLISVILPVYNAGSYITTSIQSILDQSYTNFELLIIDDASTDNTLEIINKFDDDRLIIFKKERNLGLVDSLNKGFNLAKGKYIARMDGDDISHPLRFEKQLNFLEANPQIKACGCWLKIFGAQSKILKYSPSSNKIQVNLLVSNPMPLGAAMLVKEAFKDFKFDKDQIHVEDYDFWARSAWECRFYNIQEVLYMYRAHEDQVSTKYKSIQIEGDIRIKLDLYNKLQYDSQVFPETFIKQKFFNKQIKSYRDFLLLLKWSKELVKNNHKLSVFDKNEFDKHIARIRIDLIYHVFFLNPEPKVNKLERLKILYALRVSDLVFILKNKLKLKD